MGRASHSRNDGGTRGPGLVAGLGIACCAAIGFQLLARDVEPPPAAPRSAAATGVVMPREATVTSVGPRRESVETRAVVEPRTVPRGTREVPAGDATRAELRRVREELEATRAALALVLAERTGTAVPLPPSGRPADWVALEELAWRGRTDPNATIAALQGIPASELVTRFGTPTRVRTHDGETQWTYRRWTARGECDLRAEFELAGGRVRRAAVWTP